MSLNEESSLTFALQQNQFDHLSVCRSQSCGCSKNHLCGKGKWCTVKILAVNMKEKTLD